MKKILFSTLLATTVCFCLQASDETTTTKTELKDSSYAFDFVVKGANNSLAWRKILETPANHARRLQEKLNKNPLAKKNTPIDETIELMSKVQRFAITDKNLSALFSHASMQDPIVNPEELDPNTLIIRFYVTISENCLDDNTTIVRMTQKTLNEFIDALEHAASFTFGDIKDYYKKFETISHFNEQNENNPVKIGLSLWVKKDGPAQD